MNGLGIEKKLGRRCILTDLQEEDLSNRLIDMERRLYGLTPEDVKRIVYQFCEINGINHNFSEDTKMAGRKWLRGFLNRHSELSVRLPERTSISRAMGFNRQKVKMYFDLGPYIYNFIYYHLYSFVLLPIIVVVQHQNTAYVRNINVLMNCGDWFTVETEIQQIKSTLSYIYINYLGYVCHVYI